MKRRQAGFTLTELMVVVSIIGVLVTMAIVYMRPHVRPIDVATRVGDLVHEASRRAVALGPVRADVVVFLGSKARTQITATQSAGIVTFRLDRLEEGTPASASTWVAIETYTVDVNVLPVKWAAGVVGNVPGSGYWGPAPTVPPAASPPVAPGDFVSQCRPDGTCDARTLFFQAAIQGSTYEYQAKLTIMPLGGAITTSLDWN